MVKKLIIALQAKKIMPTYFLRKEVVPTYTGTAKAIIIRKCMMQIYKKK